MQEEGKGQKTGDSNVSCMLFLLAAPVVFLMNPVLGIILVPVWACLLVPLLDIIVKSLDPEHFPRSAVEADIVGTRAAAIEATPAPLQSEPVEQVEVLRGGGLVGNRLRFKVKVFNKSKYVITDVTVSLVSYPRDALTLEGPTVKVVTKINPNCFTSPTFDFLPSKDCIKGAVVASVSYVDDEGMPHLALTDPFQVRAVCDLLMPEVITPRQFELRLSELTHQEMTFKVEDWTPEEMLSKTLQVLEKSNFSEVKSKTDTIDQHVEVNIDGWARGKYTGKNLAVEITISGRSGCMGAICRVRVSGQDEAMILPAIDEISQKLIAWLCPMCAGEIPASIVSDIREGRQAKCSFCGVTLSK